LTAVSGVGSSEMRERRIVERSESGHDEMERASEIHRLALRGFVRDRR